MKILIEIYCEEKRELFAHLGVIRRQLKRELKDIPCDGQFDEDFELSDSNCYGDHEVYGFVDDKIRLAIDESQVTRNV